MMEAPVAVIGGVKLKRPTMDDRDVASSGCWGWAPFLLHAPPPLPPSMCAPPDSLGLVGGGHTHRRGRHDEGAQQGSLQVLFSPKEGLCTTSCLLAAVCVTTGRGREVAAASLGYSAACDQPLLRLLLPPDEICIFFPPFFDWMRSETRVCSFCFVCFFVFVSVWPHISVCVPIHHYVLLSPGHTVVCGHGSVPPHLPCNRA